MRKFYNTKKSYKSITGSKKSQIESIIKKVDSGIELTIDEMKEYQDYLVKQNGKN